MNRPRARPILLPALLMLFGACEGKTTTRSTPAAAHDSAPDPAPADAPAPTEAAPDFDALCVLPADKPATVAEACAKVRAAHDGYMTRIHAEDPEAKAKWAKDREGQLKMTEMICAKNGSIDVAACQAHAFDHATAQHLEKLGLVMRRCQEKFLTP